MAEAFVDIVGIILGRYFFGVIGASIRYGYLKVRGKPANFQKLWYDENIDPYHNQEFRSRIVGFGFVMLIVLLLAV